MSKQKTGKVYRIILAGSGRVARHHVQAISYLEKQGRARLVAICGPDQVGAETLLQKHYKGKHKHVAYYPDLTAGLAQEEADLVALATPSGTHKDLGLEALAAGCHILVEKPLAMTYADGLELAEAAAAAGKKLALGHKYRYLPCMADLASDLQAGKFGQVYYGSVILRWGHDQAYYDRAPWVGTRAADGGVILNQSVHAFDLLRWLMGLENQPLLETQGFAATQSHEMESEDLGLGVFHFAADRYISYEGTTSSQPDRQQVELFICCEQADIRAGLIGKKAHFSIRSQGKDLRWSYLRRYLGRVFRQGGLKGLWALKNPHTAIYSDLLIALEDDRDPLASSSAGLSSLEMVEALCQASGILATSPN